MSKFTLLSGPDSNAKLAASQGLGYYPVGLSLAPHKLSGYNVCSHATDGCNPITGGCIGGDKSGRAKFQANIIPARVRKTRMLFQHRDEFLDLLWADVQAAHRKAQRDGLCLALRLNVFSDLDWRTGFRHSAGWGIFDKLDTLDNVQVYDYTKIIRRAYRELSGGYKTPWTTVFSRSERNEAECLEFLKSGGSVAIPFVVPKHETPAFHDGWKVVDGDEHDLLFLRPKNRIIGLSAKSALKTENDYGFAIEPRDNVTFGGW